MGRFKQLRGNIDGLGWGGWYLPRNYVEEGVRQIPSLSFLLEGVPSNKNCIPKIQQRWGEGSNAGNIVY